MFTDVKRESSREQINCRWRADTGTFVYVGHERITVPNTGLHKLLVERAKSHRVDIHELLKRIEQSSELSELLQKKLSVFRRMQYTF